MTACPHCFNTIGNEYGQLGGEFRIVHHSQFLAELVVVGAAGDAAGGRDVGDRRPPAGQRDRPRLVLPRPLQRGDDGAARRARCGRRRDRRDGEVVREHVLLRRRRRPDVDGGDARHADQRRADPPGARDGGDDGRHGLPVLHGHAVGRAGGRGGWGRASRPWTSARSWPRAWRASPRTGACRSSSGRQSVARFETPPAKPATTAATVTMAARPRLARRVGFSASRTTIEPTRTTRAIFATTTSDQPPVGEALRHDRVRLRRDTVTVDHHRERAKVEELGGEQGGQAKAHDRVDGLGGSRGWRAGASTLPECDGPVSPVARLGLRRPCSIDRASDAARCGHHAPRFGIAPSHATSVSLRGRCSAPLVASTAATLRHPTSRVPQFEQLSSVTRLPIPHDGHRFIPSVATAKGLSAGGSSGATRSRRRIVITATIPGRR